MKFQQAASFHLIRIGSLQADRKYPIERADRVQKKFAKIVQLTIRDSPLKVTRVFLPKRYSSIFSDDDIQSINSNSVSLSLIYGGTLRKQKPSY
jgi:hypothetical protein